ncbi:MAG TPA: TetR/AcrR family transcriptional regulator [Thermoanaerobaculia bacterium]|nr:TetR/AcrR family transcriptional regulator [Thermoanaerobaculia bacterium]
MTRPVRPDSRGGGVLTRRRPPSPHVETKRRAKRARILESAVRSFAAKGFYGTSMDDIAEELLLTRGSLYYYFKDKEEILALCHETALEAMLEVTGRVRASQLPPDEALRRIVVEHVRVMVDKFHGTALAIQFDALDPKRRAGVVAARDAYERSVRDVIDDGIARKIFRPVDAKLATFAVLGSINWLARWYKASGGSSAREIGEAFSDVFLAGLLAK